jgi:predicted permease
MAFLMNDLALAVRSLLRRPGLFAGAVTSLALAIGINVAVFSVVDATLLRPLPYRAADRLAVLWHHFGKSGQALPAVHPLDLRDYKQRSRLFEDFTLVGGFEGLLQGDAEAEIVRVGNVSANFFPLLGVEPALGRPFREDEDVPGAPAVAWLGHGLWERHFGGDPRVIGRRITLDGQPHEVVGVLPRGFELFLPAEAFFVKRPEVWRPARIDVAKLPPRNWTTWVGLGRLKPGVAFAEAQEEVASIAEGFRREAPELGTGDLRARVVPLERDLVKGVRGALWALLGAVGLVLLIACTNVAHLLLARGFDREVDLRVRAALGASALRLARPVLAEGFVIASAGAVFGLLLAQIGLSSLRLAQVAAIPRLDTVALDASAIAFATVATAVATLASALVPALRAARTSQAPAGGPRATGSAEGRRLQDRLLVGQGALVVVAVVGMGLMVQSFRALVAVRLGFELKGLLTLRVALPRERFPDEQATRELFRRFEERVAGLADGASVAAVSLLPLAGAGPLQTFAYDEDTARHWETAAADYRRASPGFFRAIGATLVWGREFEWADTNGGPRRIVVDTTLARQAFPGRSAVGQRLQLDPDGGPSAFAEIVGVVAPLTLQSLTGPSLPQLYEPDVFSRSRFTLVLRTSGDPEHLASAALREFRAIAPGAAVQDVRALDRVLADTLAPVSLALGLMSAVGVVSAVLAGLGMHAAFGYSVRRRRRELGIRAALGESPARLRRAVLSRGLRLVALSGLLGGAIALTLGASAQVSLFGVHWADPGAYAATAAVLAGVALASCWAPARRASQVDPAAALRHD